ncbi:MAG TPA: hypothetical protein VI756_25965 [Blastocatellia bacterium]
MGYPEINRAVMLYGLDHVEEMRVLVRSQLEAASSGEEVKCKCGRVQPVWFLFRCFYCGVFFCTTCARAHFAKDGPVADEGVAGDQPMKL